MSGRWHYRLGVQGILVISRQGCTFTEFYFILLKLNNKSLFGRSTEWYRGIFCSSLVFWLAKIQRDSWKCLTVLHTKLTNKIYVLTSFIFFVWCINSCQQFWQINSLAALCSNISSVSVQYKYVKDETLYVKTDKGEIYWSLLRVLSSAVWMSDLFWIRMIIKIM